MKTYTNSSAALKADTSVEPVADRKMDVRRQLASEQEKEILLKQMAMALCRQYIMWPTTGLLPCQKNIACDKFQSCQKMAQDVIVYADGFPKR